MKIASLLTIMFLAMSTCNEKVTLTQAEEIMFQAIDAHGGDLYDEAHYEFIFRGKKFTFLNDGASYEYTREFDKDGRSYFDKMNNDGFVRTVDGLVDNLDDKMKSAIGESVNSVIYFATLPHKLRDKSVNKSYIGEVDIKGKKYDVLQITFNQEGGGKDFDDTYHYWINKQTKIIDFLAYNYTVNKGGVRFREAYNQRSVGGIIFQDYVNYKADVGTPLIELPALWEKGKLKELSKIETQNIKEL